MSERV